MDLRDTPKILFLTAAASMALLVILIFGFIAWTAAPVLVKTGPGFITGTVWDYDTSTYGILVFIAGTLVLTAVTMAIVIPIGILTAIYLAEWAPAPVERILRPSIELLIGIPSVVFGIFGFFVLRGYFAHTINPAIGAVLGWIPFLRDTTPGSGTGILLAATVLSVMTLPTIVALSQEAMRSVPKEFREASLALGATRWETVRHVVLPSAFPGILTSVILAMMRAAGETMAVVMLLGNLAELPGSVLGGGYAMTSKILNDIGFYMGEAEPRSALFAIALVLFIIEIGMVAIVRAASARIRGACP
ncbi:MAG TPA: phosphate ABC transporter permease subunit PstC [Methanomicrobiales archaeon]|nr:phosphate ABC transporter permease subunit PstC [Methanomicrobiales archaeon]